MPKSNDLERLNQLLQELKPRTRQILVVDDDAIFREFIRFHFKEADEAADGVEAIEKLDKKQYDIVLIDLRLPRLTGFDVLHHVKKTGNGFPILLSGFIDYADIQDAGGACAVDKVDTDAVIKMIKKVM